MRADQLAGMSVRDMCDELTDDLSVYHIDEIKAELERRTSAPGFDAGFAAGVEASAKLAEETKIIGPMGIVLCGGEQAAEAIRRLTPPAPDREGRP